jgi:AraC-like DNA-binding protein
VHFTECAFSPHRHDTYAVGITTAGVQLFGYRGSRRTCLPGQVHVLHPDELHDGRAGTDAGFSYRIVYVDPALVREALGGGPLPFVADPVHDTGPATADLVRLLADMDDPLDGVARADAAAAVASALSALAGEQPAESGSIDLAAVARVRQYLAEHARERTTAATLERIAGIDRYTLARHFRRAYGTSPDRYRSMRRLALARAALEAGTPLADAAHEAGFADQSHMTRHFRRAYGMPPGRWASVAAQGSGQNGDR